MNAIPLIRPDLTGADEQALLAQLRTAPFRDDALLRRWEAAWETLWQRRAVAFADPVAAVAALKETLAWPAGARIAADPLLAPGWREGCDAAWLHLDRRDADPVTGQGRGPWPTPPTAAGHGAAWVVHAFGLPNPVATDHPVLLEEVSGLVKPLPGSGHGTVQLLLLGGNAILQGGESCLLLSRDERLIAGLAQRRRHPPGAAACALGLSQLARLDRHLERRTRLAERYLALRGRGLVGFPSSPGAVRAWELLHLLLPDRAHRDGLRAFLHKAGIGADGPVWSQPPDLAALPGLARFADTALALPLYAALDDREQKKIINRLHRWLERTGKSR